MTSQTSISTFTDHTDYVRAGQVSSSTPHTVLTGSYDGTVRLFDARSGECEMVMGESISSTSKLPVEQVLMFSSGTVAVSAAGPILRVWDLVGGGRCIKAMSNHQKTITSLAVTSSGNRLLTGSLDHMVKVYDVENYKVVHTMRYPAPLLCLAISVSKPLHYMVHQNLNLSSPTTPTLSVECQMALYRFGEDSKKEKRRKPSVLTVLTSSMWVKARCQKHDRRKLSGMPTRSELARADDKNG